MGERKREEGRVGEGGREKRSKSRFTQKVESLYTEICPTTGAGRCADEVDRRADQEGQGAEAARQGRPGRGKSTRVHLRTPADS